MRNALANTLSRLACWLKPKSAPYSLSGNQWTGTWYIDKFQRERQPNNNELLGELKGTAWTCATINASICAAYPPKLYVATFSGTQPVPKCPSRPLDAKADKRLRACPAVPAAITKAARIEEVLDHPLLTLLQQVNSVH